MIEGRRRFAPAPEEQPRHRRRGKKQLHCELPQQLYARVEHACRERDVSLSQAVREALRLWVVLPRDVHRRTRAGPP